MYNRDNNQEHSSGNHGKSMSDFLMMIRERWMIALLLALALAGGYTWKKLQEVPLYRSFSTVTFDIDRNRVVNIQEVVDTSIRQAPDMVLRNHLLDLRSGRFQSQVVNSLTESERELIIAAYRDPESKETPNIHEIIRNANQIKQIGGHIFSFEFHHRTPEATTLLANRFAEQFEQFLIERGQQGNDSAIRFLRAQSEELRLRVERGELEVQQYRQSRNLVSLEESQNLIVERMKSISGSLNTARIALFNYDAQVRQLDAVMEAGGNPNSLAFISRQTSIASRLDDLSRLESLRAGLALRYRDKHPRMIENDTQRESLQREIDDAVRLAVQDLRRGQMEQQQQVDSLTEALAFAEQEALKLDQMAIEYNVLRRKLAADRELFSQIHQRLNETMISSQLINSGMRMTDRAFIPGSPFTPDRAKIFTVAGFLFALTFCGFPILLDMIGNRLKSAGDIEGVLKKEYLGEIHRIRGKSDEEHYQLVLRQEPKLICELFRMAYSQIVLNTDNRYPKCFVVTSALPREGKSFFSANLAACFSRHHHRTLLIDGDLRRPSQQKGFEVPRNRGLLHWYHTNDDPDLTSLADIGVVSVAPDFDLLPAGGSTQEATEVIRSQRLVKLMARFKTLYDVVIIDSSPSGVFPDAACFAEMADHTLFVTRPKIHKLARIRGILRRLDQSNGKVMGIIFNMTDRKHGSRYSNKYYDYRHYGKYYADEAAEAMADAKAEQSEKNRVLDAQLK